MFDWRYEELIEITKRCYPKMAILGWLYLGDVDVKEYKRLREVRQWAMNVCADQQPTSARISNLQPAERPHCKPVFVRVASQRALQDLGSKRAKACPE